MEWYEYITREIPFYGSTSEETLYNVYFTLFFWGVVVTLMGWDKRRPKS